MATSGLTTTEPGAKVIYQRGRKPTRDGRRPSRSTTKVSARDGADADDGLGNGRAMPPGPVPGPAGLAGGVATSPVAPAIDLNAIKLEAIRKHLQKIDDRCCWLRIAADMMCDVLSDMEDLPEGIPLKPFLMKHFEKMHFVLKFAEPMIAEVDETTHRSLDLAHELATPADAIDPVRMLWPELLAADAAYRRADEEADPEGHAALEEKWEEVSSRFVMLQPTTAAGMALKLRYLAYTNSHEHPSAAGYEDTRIIRDLVRQLSGDANWTATGKLAPQEK
jgi:hypothetical protein